MNRKEQKVSDLVWVDISSKTHAWWDEEEDILMRVSLPDGSRITVLDRMTGFGYRDIETGYRNRHGVFWLAAGQFDIRTFPHLTVEQAVAFIKRQANESVPEDS